MYTVFGFYKFKKLKSLNYSRIVLQKLFIENNIKGIFIISKEGINGTLSGELENIFIIKKKIKSLLKFVKYDNENFSKSEFQPFHKPKVKIKKEVVPMGLKILLKAKLNYIRQASDPKFLCRFLLAFACVAIKAF